MDMNKYSSTQLQEKEIINDQPHSVQFDINAKGQWSGKAKAYGQTPDIAYSRALKLALDIEQLIQTKNK